jgi:hypothetical protein
MPAECNDPELSAEQGSNDDGSWFSRCACGVVTCASGTYDEALEALLIHRGESA